MISDTGKKRKTRIESKRGKRILATITMTLEADRFARGMSQRDYVEFLGISLPMYVNMLSGKANPTLYMIDRLAEAIGKKPSELMFGHVGKEKKGA